MARKLKVYGTAVGFHDAYIAAPSQKAALQAWGSESNLFSLGMAEIVTDDALTKAPLEEPGKIIKVPRGSAEEHFASLPPSPPADRPGAKADEDGREEAQPRAEARVPRATTKRPVKRRPRPSRDKLDKAEKALELALIEQEGAVAAIRTRERNLQRERHALEKRHEAKVVKLEAAIAKSEQQYRAALDKWRNT